MLLSYHGRMPRPALARGLPPSLNRRANPRHGHRERPLRFRPGQVLPHLQLFCTEKHPTPLFRSYKDPGRALKGIRPLCFPSSASVPDESLQKGTPDASVPGGNQNKLSSLGRD